MITQKQIRQLVFALTLKCGHLEVACREVISRFGTMPQVGPEMLANFERVGIPSLVEMWERLIAEQADVAAYAQAEWELYLEKSKQLLPSLPQRAANLAGAVAAEAAAIARQAPPVSKATQKRRLSICQTCDLLKPDTQTCTLCGCYVEAKTKFRSQQCPATPPKWKRLSPVANPLQAPENTVATPQKTAETP